MEADLRTTHERDLLGTICDYKLTPAILTILFHPNTLVAADSSWITITKKFPLFLYRECDASVDHA